MAATQDDWSSNANDAVHIQQIVPDAGSHKTINAFNPTYTHVIFGDEESIFGYKGLNINLFYNASDMRPCLNIEYKKKFKAVGDVEPTDIKGAFEGCLPDNAFEKVADFDKHIASSNTFKPTGELLRTSTAPEDDGEIEIYLANASDPAVKQLLTRLQILNLFYIDGGTALRDDEYASGRWTVYTMYHKASSPAPNQSAYKFLGYSTVYAYHPIVPSVTPMHPKEKINIPYPYPADFVSDLPVRSRISQFVILPPYQNSGLGAQLYSAVYKSLFDDPLVFEVTVEDPSEAFDDLRDLNDLAFLRTIPEFEKLRINVNVKATKKARIPTKLIIEGADLEQLRRKYKIAPRQFQRVVEMHLLTTIPKEVRRSVVPSLEFKPSKAEESAEFKQAKHAYRLWCLIAKQRLYKHNHDTMIQLPRGERIEKLEETLYGVEMDYLRLLRKLERGPGKHPEEDATGGREDVDEADESEGEGEDEGEQQPQQPVQVNILQGKKRAGSDAVQREAKKAKN